MTNEQAERNIKLYYLFQLFKEPLFWGAILITFITHVSGMSLADICYMESICVIIMIILDGPMGALADLIGRRKTLMLGMGTWLVMLLVFASAVNPLMIWIGNFLCFIGAALINGSDTSMLADSLKFLGREQDFQKIQGRSGGYRLGLTAGCAILVGYLAEINLRFPVYLGLPFMLIACVAVYFMVEPPVIANKTKSCGEYWRLLKTSAVFIFNHREIKWLIAFSTLIIIVSKIWFFTYNPYFELVDLPLAYFGWLFCALNIVAAICSHESQRITNCLGNFGGMILIVVMIATPILLMGLYVSKIMALMILFQNIVRGYMMPFLGGITHQILNSENRATVVSLNSTITNIGQVIVLAIYGLALSAWSLPICLQILGISALVLGSLLLSIYHWSFRLTTH